MSKSVDYCELKDSHWNVWQQDDGRYDYNSVQRAILLDIRSQLYDLNRVFACRNAQAIPLLLRKLVANTTKPKPKPKPKPKAKKRKKR